MNGFYGRILNVNLSQQLFKIVSISDQICQKYLGGKGLAAHLLYELNPPGVDPLAPENTRFAMQDYRKKGALVIGPASENLVRFGCIKNDYWRSAGRTGAGTVLGSKK